MKIKCPHCGGGIIANSEKINTVVGGSLLISAVAAIFGLAGGGWLPLGIAALGGSSVARSLLQVKVKLMQASQSLGSFFKCKQCGTSIAVGVVFAQIFDSLGIQDDSPSVTTKNNLLPASPHSFTSFSLNIEDHAGRWDEVSDSSIPAHELVAQFPALRHQLLAQQAPSGPPFRTRLLQIRNERDEPVAFIVESFMWNIDNSWSWGRSGRYEFDPGKEAYLLDQKGEKIHASKVKLHFRGLHTGLENAPEEWEMLSEPDTSAQQQTFLLIIR